MSSKDILNDYVKNINKIKLKEDIRNLIINKSYVLHDNINNNESIKYYLDYNVKRLDMASKSRYKCIDINIKEGLTKEIVLNIITNISDNIENNYIVINSSKIITKKNADSINDIIIKNKEENIITKTYIRKNIPKFLNELKKKSKILIISLSNYQIIKRVFKYYDIDKYIAKYFTPDIYLLKKESKSEKVRNLMNIINNYIDNNIINQEGSHTNII